MQDVEFDLTNEYADLAAVKAACPVRQDAWAYVLDVSDDTAVVFAMTAEALYAPKCNLTLVRTYEQCVVELGKLVGV